jgi:CBS domain-containing protein
MLVSDLLKTKSGDVQLIIETATLSAAAGLMTSSRIGALVVEDADGKMTGLISERELTAALARWGANAPQHQVRDIMIRNPLIVQPSETLIMAMSAMTNQRARHVPVMDGDTLVGILSIGDVLKSRLDEKTTENLVLQDIARSRPGLTAGAR